MARKLRFYLDGCLPHWQDHNFEMTREEHEVVFNAIMEGNGVEAANVMRSHLVSLRERILTA